MDNDSNTPYYTVKVQEAKDIVKMDMIGYCDPYFVMRYGSQEQRTTTKQNANSGVWNETFRFPVVDDAIENLEIYAYDQEANKSGFFGRCMLNIATSVPFEGWVEMWNPQDADHPKGASLKISITYNDPTSAKKSENCLSCLFGPR
eukprot:CAMPEP_0113936308 /NCGR_PEP_ID=MMETSP1339-20121228/3244_1 /TAXON_ID=94617 /ORGANISM="Fibrocapsa japonica" /LENGTH=145 /DNA_ID=CAMNT_0000938729 /DNA_START=104 /DNA_END=541 /DNA_ORIENTATION=+ /assembly_acc=CAM_ASM_000762